MPDRVSFAQSCARSRQTELWFEDSTLAFDVVTKWVSDGFSKNNFPSVSMTEFALDFYAAEPTISVSSSESEQDPSADCVAHWSAVYEEAGLGV